MVSGTQWPGGDPFLQRQNEPSIAVSSANPQHLLAGANDYRSVDIPDPSRAGQPRWPADAWQGVFKSYDGGQTWKSYLMPGYPQDTSCDGTDSAARSGNRTARRSTTRRPTRGPGGHRRHVLLRRHRLRARHERRPRRPQPVHRPERQGERRPGRRDRPDPAGWTPRSSTRAGPTSPTSPGSPSTSRGPARSPATSRRRLSGNVSSSAPSWVGPSTWSGRASTATPRPTSCSPARSTAARRGALPLKLNDATSLASQGRGRLGRSAHRRRLRRLAPVRGSRREPAAGRRHLRRAHVQQGDTSSPARACSRRSRPSTRPRTRPPALPHRGPPHHHLLGQPRRHAELDPRGLGPAGRERRQPDRGEPRPGRSRRPPRTTRTTTRCDGWKIPAVPLDTAPITDDAGNAFTRGHQFMPQLTFSQGRIVAVYYDSRLDHTRNYYSPPSRSRACRWEPAGVPNPKGRWYTEERGPLGERGLDLDWVLDEIDDYRHDPDAPHRRRPGRHGRRPRPSRRSRASPSPGCPSAPGATRRPATRTRTTPGATRPTPPSVRSPSAPRATSTSWIPASARPSSSGCRTSR